MAQPSNVEAVKRAILDYVEGAYEVDTTKTVRSVHPDLVKEGYYYENGEYTEFPMNYKQLIQAVRHYNKDGIIPNNAPKEVEVFEVMDKIASAKLTAHWGVDYFHLVKIDGKWMITQVVWQTN